MRIKVQITLESGGGKSEMIEVTNLERASLRPDTLGLSLAEAQCSEALYERNFHSAAQMLPLMGGIRHFCCS
jgi:hypothetical protein